MRSFASKLRRRWKWGPVALGLSIGVSLAFVPGTATATWLAFVLGGLFVSLFLVAGPPALDAMANALASRAYRSKGLPWPPVIEEAPTTDPDDVREALQKIAVELENNAILLEEKIETKKVWNSRNRKLEAGAYSAYSTLLSRHRSFPYFQTLSTLYNESKAFNHKMFREFTASLNNRRVSDLTDTESSEMTALAERSREMGEAILDELP